MVAASVVADPIDLSDAQSDAPVHDLADFGARELDADGEPIYELSEFGSVEV